MLLNRRAVAVLTGVVGNKWLAMALQDKKISKDLYEWLVDMKLADQMLIAKWRKPVRLLLTTFARPSARTHVHMRITSSLARSLAHSLTHSLRHSRNMRSVSTELIWWRGEFVAAW